jgi:hypothetical protein
MGDAATFVFRHRAAVTRISKVNAPVFRCIKTTQNRLALGLLTPPRRPACVPIGRKCPSEPAYGVETGMESD